MPQRPQPTYLKADSLDQAWQALEQHGQGARPVWVSPQPPDLTVEPVEYWVDLSDCSISAIEQQDSHLQVGAGVSLRELMDSEKIDHAFAGLIKRAARKTGHHGLRNLAQLGAVLQAPATAPELSAALLAGDPDLVIFNGEERTIKLEQAWSQRGDKWLPLRLDFESVKADKAGAGLHWVGRSPMDKAIVVAACTASISQGRIEWVNLVVAGDGFQVQRLTEIENDLEGIELASLQREQLMSAARNSVKPEPSYRAGIDYQLHLIGVLSQRALAEALGGVNYK